MGFFFSVGEGGGGIFGGFYFCLHSIDPVTWNLEYPPWALHKTWFLHNFSQSTRVNRKQIRCVFVAANTHMPGSTCVAGRMHGFQNVSSPFSPRPRSSSTKTLLALTIPPRTTQAMFRANNSALENKLLPCQRTPWFHNQFFPVWLDQHTTKKLIMK